MYQKQWVQRKRFYKNNNYKIFNICSNNYINMDTSNNNWKLTFEPKDKSAIVAKEKPKCLINLSENDINNTVFESAYYN